jgi:2-amino-4-hydroxy-6-hydroxymethyldihydropteridine diphosphokinase/dihydropteroate synthase
LANPALIPENSPKNWNKEFFNIAFSGQVDLSKFHPIKILQIIKNIEAKIGRVDRGKWSPREIDIDIAFIENIFFENENLSIPHKQLVNREFFIKPIMEIEKKLLLNIFPNLSISS